MNEKKSNVILNQATARRIAFGLIAVLAAARMCTQPAIAEDAVSPAAGSAPKVVGRAIAVVNNEPIFADDLERESEPFIERHRKTAPEKEQTKEKIEELRKEILDKMIEEKLLLQEAKNKKLRITKAEIERGIAQFKDPFSVDPAGKPRTPQETEKKFQEQLVKEGMTQEQFGKRVEEQIMKVKLIEQEVKSKVEMPKDEDVKGFYDKIQLKMAGKPVESKDTEEETDLVQVSKYLERVSGEQVRIRHILLRSSKNDISISSDQVKASVAEAKKKAEEVQQKIKKGEDFAFLAKKYSEDPISRERGGDLGFISKGDLGLPEIDSQVFKMDEGRISDIIETDIGFHIIKLIEKKSPHPVEYEDIKEDLKNVIAQRVFTQKLDRYIKDLRARSNIKVNSLN